MLSSFGILQPHKAHYSILTLFVILCSDGNISETWLDDSEDEEVKTEVRPSIDILKLYQSSRREGPLSSRRNPSRRSPSRRSPSRRSISPPRKKPSEYEDEYSGDGDGDSIEFNM